MKNKRKNDLTHRYITDEQYKKGTYSVSYEDIKKILTGNDRKVLSIINEWKSQTQVTRVNLLEPLDKYEVKIALGNGAFKPADKFDLKGKNQFIVVPLTL